MNPLLENEASVKMTIIIITRYVCKGTYVSVEKYSEARLHAPPEPDLELWYPKADVLYRP